MEVLLALKRGAVGTAARLHRRVVVGNRVFDLVELLRDGRRCTSNAADAALYDFVGFFSGQRWTEGEER